MSLLIKFKKALRPLYYFFWHNRITVIKYPEALRGFNWLIDRRFDRAYYKGYYEPEMTNYFIKNVQNGNTFLDIGGHAGYFSFLFSRLSPNGYIFVFEPDPKNSQFIRKLISVNNSERITLITKAVGSTRGELYYNPGPTSSTGKVNYEEGAEKVEVECIDDYLADKDVTIDFVKIDVEGFGADVIKGMIKTIKKNKPTILYEIHNAQELDEITKLKELGYRYFTFDEKEVDLNSIENRFILARYSQ